MQKNSTFAKARQNPNKHCHPKPKFTVKNISPKNSSPLKERSCSEKHFSFTEPFPHWREVRGGWRETRHRKKFRASVKHRPAEAEHTQSKIFSQIVFESGIFSVIPSANSDSRALFSSNRFRLSKRGRLRSPDRQPCRSLPAKRFP